MTLRISYNLERKYINFLQHIYFYIFDNVETTYSIPEELLLNEDLNLKPLYINYDKSLKTYTLLKEYDDKFVLSINIDKNHMLYEYFIFMQLAQYIDLCNKSNNSVIEHIDGNFILFNVLNTELFTDSVHYTQIKHICSEILCIYCYRKQYNRNIEDLKNDVTKLIKTEVFLRIVILFLYFNNRFKSDKEREDFGYNKQLQDISVNNFYDFVKNLNVSDIQINKDDILENLNVYLSRLVSNLLSIFELRNVSNRCEFIKDYINYKISNNIYVIDVPDEFISHKQIKHHLCIKYIGDNSSKSKMFVKNKTITLEIYINKEDELFEDLIINRLNHYFNDFISKKHPIENATAFTFLEQISDELLYNNIRFKHNLDKFFKFLISRFSYYNYIKSETNNTFTITKDIFNSDDFYKVIAIMCFVKYDYCNYLYVDKYRYKNIERRLNKNADYKNVILCIKELNDDEILKFIYKEFQIKIVVE